VPIPLGWHQSALAPHLLSAPLRPRIEARHGVPCGAPPGPWSQRRPWESHFGFDRSCIARTMACMLKGPPVLWRVEGTHEANASSTSRRPFARRIDRSSMRKGAAKHVSSRKRGRQEGRGGTGRWPACRALDVSKPFWCGCSLACPQHDRRDADRCDCAMQGWHLQLQPAPRRDMLSPRGRG
jgi:hypothetical protein